MSAQLPPEWNDPPVEFSLAPFWFWNDELRDDEIARQIGEFQAHNVDAFVIHPRVGLPRHQGWMSKTLLAKMRFAIEEARQRGMWVILYDEGMYPSGSASGQVVAGNPSYQCRGLVRIDLDAAPPQSIVQGVAIGVDGQPALKADQTLVAVVAYKGRRYAIIDRPIDSVIRGLHFINEDANVSSGDAPPEDEPPAADLLNPDAVAAFIRHSYERYYQAFGEFFGSTIQAIFTDEPNLLGRPRETNVIPGTTDILSHVNDFLGYDFTPYLPALWDETAPEDYRRDYLRAVEHRLEATYYAQLYQWCESHHIALTGHPAEPDATTLLRYFHIPGQDIVWRYIEPDQPSALAGRQSTQAKAASSAMLHQQRRRNANEFCGAYGAQLTFDELRWLANWLLVRGCNLLIPHAFYYSVRGPRQYERPPDVGLHSPWWDETFTTFALGSKRLCWLNTDSTPVCPVVILGEHHRLPWRAAAICFQHQIDFNYLDVDDLLQRAAIHNDYIEIGGQRYHTLIIDGEITADLQPMLDRLTSQVNVLCWNDDEDASLAALLGIAPPDLRVTPACPGLRVRHIRKAKLDWYLLFNEAAQAIDATIETGAFGMMRLIDPYTNAVVAFDGKLYLAGHDLRVLVCELGSE